MTVSTTTNKVSYIGNGVAVGFAVPFPFLERAHLKVRQLLNGVQTERTDWTVSGGNLVFETAPADGAKIVIMREVPLTQETDYQENEILPAETLERNFDKLTMQVQQLAEEQGRSVKVGVFSNTDPVELVKKVEDLWVIKDDMTANAQNMTAIVAVNNNAANINAVNADAANINAVAADLTNIDNASAHAANASVWAEGTDEQVQAIGGTHSAKEWATISTGANRDLSNLTAEGNDKFVTKDTAQTISGVKTFSTVPVMTGTLTATDNSSAVPTTAWVREHCCESAATTTSTASKDAPAYVVENYRNGYNWYRVWSDGWIEQGGYASGTTVTSNQQISLNKAFSGTNYCVKVTAYTTDNVSDARYTAVINQTTSSFKTYYTCNKLWFACGY